MDKSKKIYWKGLPELKKHAAFMETADEEFQENSDTTDVGHSRRDFLKMMGFSLAAVTTACQAPVRKAIPYIVKPADVDPGISNYYASTYANGGEYCSIVMKVRDGRPIKIAGNTLSPITRGGISAQVEASVLSLYDEYRLRNPKIKGQDAEWAKADAEIKAALDNCKNKGEKIYIVCSNIISRSTAMVLLNFMQKYPNVQGVSYDPVSHNGIRLANKACFDLETIPSYDFSKAQVIVSVAADFLGTWIAPIEYSKQYAENRVVTEAKSDMSRHYQFESLMSLTGANADYRTMIKPSQEGAVLVSLYNLLAAKAGTDTLGDGGAFQNLEQAADDLWANRGNSLVVAGSNNREEQIIVNAINSLLGNYGVALDVINGINYFPGDDAAMDNFVTDVASGKAGAVIFYNCNPVYDHPRGEELGVALKKIALTVSTSCIPDETASECVYMTPDHYYLESWNDFNPRGNHASLSQPAITPIFNTRQAQDSFLTWSGETGDYYTLLKNNWQTWYFNSALANNPNDFQSFWDKCLFNGFLDFNETNETKEVSEIVFKGDVKSAAQNIGKTQGGEFELVIYQNGTVGTGYLANNPLLQELPDPITKAVWDQYVTISPADAAKLGIDNDAEGNTQLISVTANSKTVVLPALVQPGQMSGTLGIAVGYGRTKAGVVADGIGKNVYHMASFSNGSIQYNITSGVAAEKQNADFQIAQTQLHQTYMGRMNVVQETSLKEYHANPFAFKEEAQKISKWDDKVEPSTLSMWKGHEYKDHHWAMAIDLNACTGCGACVVSCNVENNVALVGKEEVINRREMHWLRIDRYYSSPAGTAEDDYKNLEKTAENPEVVFQPMMCQHCNNAPCETVCPVAATTHSSEGLNQMAYNRCIGTRYCANNCPYKVRRFNWFKYHTNEKFLRSNPSMNTDLGRMVLNPDVTVRSRGVMEKCSFCVQRIQEGKLTAKREVRAMKEDEVVTACQAACTTGAIVFGDINREDSAISKLLGIEKDKEKPYGIDKKANNPRAYRVVDEIGVKPNVYYLTKIRNKTDENHS